MIDIIEQTIEQTLIDFITSKAGTQGQRLLAVDKLRNFDRQRKADEQRRQKLAIQAELAAAKRTKAEAAKIMAVAVEIKNRADEKIINRKIAADRRRKARRLAKHIRDREKADAQ